MASSEAEWTQGKLHDHAVRVASFELFEPEILEVTLLNLASLERAAAHFDRGITESLQKRKERMDNIT